MAQGQTTTQGSGLKSEYSESFHFIEKMIPKAHPVEAEGAFSQGIFFDVPTKNDLKTLASVKLPPSEKDKKYSIEKLSLKSRDSKIVETHRVIFGISISLNSKKFEFLLVSKLKQESLSVANFSIFRVWKHILQRITSEILWSLHKGS